MVARPHPRWAVTARPAPSPGGAPASRRFRLALLLLAGLLACGGLLAGCLQDSPCARHPEGRFDLDRLVLQPGSHPVVQRAAVCATCHPYSTIHLENCTGFAFIDVAAIRNQVEEEGERSCAGCHGTPDGWR